MADFVVFVTKEGTCWSLEVSTDEKVLEYGQKLLDLCCTGMHIYGDVS